MPSTNPDWPTKKCPKKLNLSPCIMCYTQKMKTFPKGKKFETSKIQPGDLIHIYSGFYNVNSIQGFTSMITVFCEKTRMLQVLHSTSKKHPVHTVRFIITTLKNEQHPHKRVRVDEDGALENSTYAPNLLIDDFNISMETTGCDASWINGKNERHTRSIKNIVQRRPY